MYMVNCHFNDFALRVNMQVYVQLNMKIKRFVDDSKNNFCSKTPTRNITVTQNFVSDGNDVFLNGQK